ncbi:MAG TPA: glycosyltransferase family 2 protein [Terracidiphilus sp.]|nr:glycosyltransferase family 2 protein [Terracidiphilus sp.]
MNVALIILTLNAASHWEELSRGIERQSLAPDDVLVIDSASTDGTADRARDAGFRVIEIGRGAFSHGGTRQTAALFMGNADVLIYLTQDAIPRGTESFRRLVDAFQNPTVGAAYGRQIPRANASAIEAHARLFNYHAASQLRSWESRTTLGFKSIFFSNTFGAFRRDALMSIGGFAPDVSFGEDTLAVARLHRAGWSTAYVAEAEVEHSHAYSLRAEFRRYVEIGALHERERWLIEEFGDANGEGMRFVVSELRYLLRNSPHHIPAAMLRTVVKYLAYRQGRLKGSVRPQAPRRLTAKVQG